MRVLRFLFWSVLFLLIVGGVGFFVAREALMFMGLSTVKSSLTEMRQISVNAGTYIQQCQQKGLVDSGQPPIEKIQLLFTSERDYEINVICNQFLLDPIVASRQQLPLFVTKVPGTSGFIWSQNLTGITLQVWGLERSLVLEDLEVKQVSGRLNIATGSGPAATCSGYGFSCCMAESSQGQGEQIGVANDCPRSCFSQCVSRPIVLAFTSEPFFDAQTRTLTLNGQESVTFYYVADQGAADSVTATMTFGDGQSENFTGTSGTTTHSYSCSTPSCTYTARLDVIDSKGVSAATTGISQLTVIVNP